MCCNTHLTVRHVVLSSAKYAHISEGNIFHLILYLNYLGTLQQVLLSSSYGNVTSIIWIAELRDMPRCFSIKLHSETQVSGRLGMSGDRSPRHAQNPLSGEGRKTLSITHHALSPPPSHHHLYIIHLIN